MKVITFAHLKGGTAKTTSTGYLAHALDNMGYNVLVIDADPQGSLLRWSRRAKWTIPVRHLPSARLDEKIAGLYTDDFDFIVIDTAPYDDEAIVSSAMRAADIVILPARPSSADVERIKATYATADKEGYADRTRILLTQAHATGPDAKNMREAQTAAGRKVMNAEIRPRRSVERTTALLPVKPDHGYSGYTGVALELLS